jgi:translation initiation factor 2 beta subunit (eIF-2beta)/eIF-5
LKYNQAAKRLGVTPTELKRFIDQKPQAIRKGYNRSPAYRKLYVEGQRSETRAALGLKRIRRYDISHRSINLPQNLQKYPNSKQIGALIQRYYYDNGIVRIRWAAYTTEADLPLSMDAIKQLRLEGKLSKKQYEAAVDNWRKIYNVSDSWASRYEDIDDVDDYFNEGEE